MFTSFSTALSALSAVSTAVDVVGNNLANLNTPGYKTSVVYFRDLVSQSLGAGLSETQVGFGTGRPLTIRQFAQGAIQASNGVLDAAIQGDGFFIIRNEQNNVLYTRAGSFQVDATGNLLTNTGERVQGWTTQNPLTGAVDTNGAIGDITVPVGSLKKANPTSQFTADLNLDSSAAPDASSDFSTPITVYDSLGTSHVLSIKFEKTGSGAWTYGVTMPGDEVTGGTPGQPFDIPSSTGTLTFDANGQLTAPAPGSTINFDLTGLTSGAADVNLQWNPFTASGGARMTQFAQKSAVSATSQNGSAAAQLVRIGLADGGQILAAYSDGLQVMVGQIAMASIRNPESLIAAGNNNYQGSAATASAAVGVAGTGGRGTINGGAIEYSTVDIAKEFTNLIVLQRSYQANSRVITTVDEMSQETINLKR